MFRNPVGRVKNSTGVPVVEDPLLNSKDSHTTRITQTLGCQMGWTGFSKHHGPHTLKESSAHAWETPWDPDCR